MVYVVLWFIVSNNNFIFYFVSTISTIVQRSIQKKTKPACVMFPQCWLSYFTHIETSLSSNWGLLGDWQTINVYIHTHTFWSITTTNGGQSQILSRTAHHQCVLAEHYHPTIELLDTLNNDNDDDDDRHNWPLVAARACVCLCVSDS